MKKRNKGKRRKRLIIPLLTLFFVLWSQFSPEMTTVAADSELLPGTLFVGGVKMAPEGTGKIDLGSGTASR